MSSVEAFAQYSDSSGAHETPDAGVPQAVREKAAAWQAARPELTAAIEARIEANRRDVAALAREDWIEDYDRDERFVMVDGPMTGEQVTRQMREWGIPNSLERARMQDEQRAAKQAVRAEQRASQMEWEGFGR